MTKKLPHSRLLFLIATITGSILYFASNIYLYVAEILNFSNNIIFDKNSIILFYILLAASILIVFASSFLLLFSKDKICYIHKKILWYINGISLATISFSHIILIMIFSQTSKQAIIPILALTFTILLQLVYIIALIKCFSSNILGFRGIRLVLIYSLMITALFIIVFARVDYYKESGIKIYEYFNNNNINDLTNSKKHYISSNETTVNTLFKILVFIPVLFLGYFLSTNKKNILNKKILLSGLVLSIIEIGFIITNLVLIKFDKNEVIILSQFSLLFFILTTILYQVNYYIYVNKTKDDEFSILLNNKTNSTTQINIAYKPYKFTIRDISEGALMVALSITLSMISKLIPFLSMPQGGQISLSMLPIFIYSLRQGYIKGMLAGFVYSIVNLLSDGFAAYHIGSIFLDYLLPFTLLGLSGIFSKKSQKGNVIFSIIGVVVFGLVRYLLHSISGVVFFGQYAPDGQSAWLYSFVIYNLPYMSINIILCSILVAILHDRLISSKTRIV